MWSIKGFRLSGSMCEFQRWIKTAVLFHSFCDQTDGRSDREVSHQDKQTRKKPHIESLEKKNVSLFALHIICKYILEAEIMSMTRLLSN